MTKQVLSCVALRLPPTEGSRDIDFLIDEDQYTVWAPVWVAAMTSIADLAELVDDEEILKEELVIFADGLRRIATTTEVAEPPREQKQY